MAKKKDPSSKKPAAAKKPAATKKPAAAKKPSPAKKKPAPAKKKPAPAKKKPAAAKKPAAGALPAGLAFPLTVLPGETHRRRAYGIMDTSGALVCPPRWELMGPFSEGLASFRANGRAGFVDRTGTLAIKPRYNQVFRFQEGRAIVRPESGGKLGAIDARGKVVIEPRYDQLEGPHQGVFTARLGDRWGLLDKDGAELTPFRFERIYPWSEGHAVVEADGRSGLLDLRGQLVLPVEFPPLYDLREGLLGCDFEGGPGYLDLQGKVAIPGPFGRLGPFSQGLALIGMGELFGYLRPDGSWLVEPSLGDVTPSYRDEPHPGHFHEGLAVYCLPGARPYHPASGYLDRSGRRVTEPIYADPKRLTGGRARVRLEGKVGYLGPDGQVAIAPRFCEAWDFAGGLARASEEKGRVGFIDPHGAWVAQPLYEQAYDFEGGVARVKRDGRWGLIDERGREVIPAEHDLLAPVGEGLVPVMTEGPDPEADARELEQLNRTLEPILVALADTVRPFLRLRLEPIPAVDLRSDGWWERERELLGPDALTCSKLGGTPWLPAGAELPRGAGGEPLALLAQLNLGALPALEGFPRTGLLQVFVAADGIPARDDLTSPAHVRVLHHPTPAGPGADARALQRALPEFPARCLARITGELAVAPISPWDRAFEQALPARLADKLDEERVNAGYHGLAQGSGHKLGGWPGFTQDDPRSEAPYRSFDRLLLQLDSDETVSWDDAGIANVFVPAAALAAGDFSRALFTSDSC